LSYTDHIIQKTSPINRIMCFFLSTIVVVTLFWWILRDIDLVKMTQALKVAHFRVLILIPVGYFLLCIARAYRLRKISVFSTVNPLNLFFVITLHSFWNNILPARTGEISFIYLAKKYFNLNVGHAAGVLFVIRIYDFAVTLIIFVSALLLLGYAGKISPLVMATLCLVFLVLTLLLWRLSKVTRGLIFFVQKLFPDISAKDRIVRLLNNFHTGITQIDSTAHLKLFAITVLCSFISFFIFQLVVSSLCLSISLAEVIVGSSFALFAVMIPINAPGNAGLLDAGWVLGFLFIGLDKSSAVLSAIIMHSMLLVSASLVGLIGYIFLYSRRTRFKGKAKRGKRAETGTIDRVLKIEEIP